MGVIRTIFIGVLAFAVTIFVGNIYDSLTDNTKYNEVGNLISFSYSPGYSDMNGASHVETLKYDDSLGWVYVEEDRESIEELTYVVIYSVDPNDVDKFEQFIKESGFLELEKRPEVDAYVLDYSPWNYRVIFDNSSFGGSRREGYHISEYQEYKKADKKLIDKTDMMFHSLKGEKISEAIEKSD